MTTPTEAPPICQEHAEIPGYIPGCPGCIAQREAEAIDCQRHALTPGYAPGCRDCARQQQTDLAALDDQNYADIVTEVAALADRGPVAYGILCQMIQGARRLTSDQVYDIELAESADGDDLIRELDAAAAHMRNASRIIEHRQNLLAKEG